MPKASLLLREPVTTSLSTIVTKSQSVRPPYSEYNLTITSTQLNIILLYKPYIKSVAHDEGIESDIDSISLVSSDDSCTSSTCLVDDHVIKHRENDSANGSSGSDTEEPISKQEKWCYQLCDVLCYTDVKFPKILVFVIKDFVYVFNFDDLDVLHNFYTSFNTLKAVTNQRTYNQTNTKFNLLQRTDNNGITHIEISREPAVKLTIPDLKVKEHSSNIISINTPEIKKSFLDDSKLVLQSELRTKSEFYPSYTLKPKCNLNQDNLKVWKSAEDLLNPPKRPERRRNKKGRAPQPPQQNIMKGQYIRVAVDPKKTIELPCQPPKQNFQTFSANIQTFTPNWSSIQTPSPLILTTVPKKNKLPDIKPKLDQTWTNSVPRLLRKPRSKSETRQTQMTYSRYIDTTAKPQQYNTTSTISNRLFGLSQKLKEFGNNVTSTRNFFEPERRNSVGEMSYKVSNESNLKSVIKKDDKKHKNEKKVTFSAYATVQVV